MSFLSYGPHTGCDFKFRLTSDLFNRRRETFPSDSNTSMQDIDISLTLFMHIIAYKYKKIAILIYPFSFEFMPFSGSFFGKQEIIRKFPLI